MAAAAIEKLKAPAGVSRDELYQETARLDRKEAARKKADKEEASAFFGKMYRTGSAVAFAMLSGFVYARFPRIKSFDADGKAPTAPVLAGVALIGAFVTEDEISDILEGTALGFGIPFLSEMTGRWGATALAEA